MASQLEFSRSTDLEEIKKRTLANYDIWGKPLSLEGYIKKVLINGFHDNYMDPLHWHYYVLKNNNGTCESSLEILLRDAWIKTKGELKVVSSGVIGSVYTDVEFRGKNNIQYLMDGLHDALDIDVFFLYSELGDYYSRFGYKSHNVPIWEFKPALDDKINESNYISKRGELETTVEVFKQHLLNCLDDDTFCLIPTVELFEWYNNRSRATFWDKRCPTSPQPVELAKGGLTNEPYDQLKYGYSFEVDGQLQYILWYVDYAYLKMSISVLEATTSNSLKALLKAALNYAKVQSIDKVEMWDLEFKLEGYLETMNELNGTKIEENSSLSAIKFKDTEYKWLGNGKWCWF